jgi:hypothetical protein
LKAVHHDLASSAETEHEQVRVNLGSNWVNQTSSWGQSGINLESTWGHAQVNLGSTWDQPAPLYLGLNVSYFLGGQRLGFHHLELLDFPLLVLCPWHHHLLLFLLLAGGSLRTSN